MKEHPNSYSYILYFMLLNMFITSCMEIVGGFYEISRSAETGVSPCQARSGELSLATASNSVPWPVTLAQRVNNSLSELYSYTNTRYSEKVLGTASIAGSAPVSAEIQFSHFSPTIFMQPVINVLNNIKQDI